jgi:hypothetical protein
VTKRGEGPWLHRIFPPGKNFEALSLILSGAGVRPRTTSFWKLLSTTPLIGLPAVLRFVSSVFVQRHLRIDCSHFHPWSLIYDILLQVVIQVFLIALPGL